MRNPSTTLPFPHRIARFGLVVMLVLAAGSIALSYQTARKSRMIMESAVVVMTDAQRLRRIAQVSQLTVQLAVETRDRRYVAAHDAEERELERTLAALLRSIVLPANAAAAERVRLSSAQLAASEQRAIELALAGEARAAEAILQSPDYRQSAKRRFDELGFIRYRALARGRKLQSDIERNSWISVLASLASLPLVGFAWLLILGPARRWAKWSDQARSTAEEAEKAKSRFVAVISHELRTPLTAIIGFTDLLAADHTLTDWQKKRIGHIREAGTALLAVINDVLDFSALEAGKLRFHEQPIPLSELVQSAMLLVQPQAKSKSLSLSIELDQRLAETYVGDFNRVRQILINLLSNAVKFTSAGWVRLSVVLEAELAGADLVRFAVRDSGCGIRPEVQPLLFQNFARVSSGSAASLAGTGLGLSISKQLVELLGGQIGFNSAPGEGSTFWFKLPLRRETSSQASEAFDLRQVSPAI